MKLIDLVNTKQGSASIHRFSNGNALPLVERPFGMAAFCPQTCGDERWYYHPTHHSFEGLRITHQPSPWIADYGTVIFMPQNGRPQFSGDSRWSGFRPEETEIRPDYFHVFLQRYRIDFEAAPAVRGGKLRVTFGYDTDNWFSVLPLKDYSEFEYLPGENMLRGIVTNCRGEGEDNFRMYFVVKFGDGEISAAENLAATSSSVSVCNEIKGENCGIHLKALGKNINAEVSTSYISYEQALLNMKNETEGKTFEEVRTLAADEWEEYLSRVTIEAKDEKQLRTFVSCMYRAFLYPHRCYEINESGDPVHYQPATGRVYPGVRYTDNGFWDTYRTCYPFYAIVAKKEYAEMCEGFVNDYEEGGWLPRWPSIGERGCMPSTLLDAVLCDAVMKDIIGKDLAERALCGMLFHANNPGPDGDHGRNGVLEYLRYGYVPIEAHKESVNLTLDAAYGDWCIARIAEKLGKTDIAEEYDKRADNYKKLFDASVGFMRAKHEDGSWREDFNPFYWGGDYTEGSAWQNSFAVPHDIAGLAALYGSKEKFIEKIDELFNAPTDYINYGYGGEIHEMTEMAAASFGQCAISNQPSFHLPYLYAEVGETEKTAYWVEKMCEEAFSYTDDGFPGDEDNGSMALWYVFGTIGIYPFCPGRNEYCRTKRLAKSVKILGKDFDADSFAGAKIPWQIFE